jgi:CheY-like chemotaxis protein
MQPSASKRPVVLIVEDETLIRLHAVEMIEAAGYDVIEAANADAAISILEQRSDIRLIFTDIEMPGSMDGIKLAHFVKGRWPPIEIIATSGHAKITHSDLPEGSRFLPKPYEAAAVTREIHRLMSNGAPS